MEFFQTLIPNFLFILLRAGIMVFFLPFFGSKTFPASFRIGFALSLALMLAPVVSFPVERAAVPLIVLREALFGMLFGLAARFLFYAVDMAGQVMSNATGLSIATVFNPEIGQSTEIARLYGILAVLLFFGVDAHHDLIALFVASYEWVPAGTPVAAADLASAGLDFTTRIFALALKISAPVVIVLLVANLLLGLLSKAVPEINVLFTGFPVYIFLGLTVMLLGLPVFAYVMGASFSQIKGELMRVMMIVKG